MNKKYQVFISSTYEDLKAERDAVVKAVLQMGHLPVGMEMFNAGDETQWETIKRYIDSSDYYIVIVAHRYGSINPTSKLSYTEEEFDYAGERDIPRLGFVIDKNIPWPPSLIEKGAAQKKLDAFKAKVGKARVIRFWDSIDKLSYHVFASLNNETTINPRVGWVRATESASPQVLEQLTRLIKENDEMRVALEAQKAKKDEITEAQEILAAHRIELESSEGVKEVTLLEAFRIVGQLLMSKIVYRSVTIHSQKDWNNAGFSLVPQHMIEKEIIRPLLEELTILDLTDKVTPEQSTVSQYQLTSKGKALLARLRYSTADKSE